MNVGQSYYVKCGPIISNATSVTLQVRFTVRKR